MALTVHRPTDAAQARAIVEQAAAGSCTLEIVAGGSKRRLGRPAQCDEVLDISALSGIVDYDPAELVLTARAATPMSAIEPLLAGERQMLAFEPPDFRSLLGGGGEPTLGGVIACNLAGPRRVRAGAARDHLLGFAAINGRGQTWRSGGRVVKNVTGYDMCKLQAGAFGTLSVLTEVSVRVVPRPQSCCTVLLHGLADADAVAAMTRALNTPHEVSGAAHLPLSSARLFGWEHAVTLLRLEGPAPSVAFRADALGGVFDTVEVLDAARTGDAWTWLGEAGAVPFTEGRCVWRICPVPSAASALVAEIAARLGVADAIYDWGGGLVWLGLDSAVAGPDAGAAVVRGAVARAGGHATLVSAPDEMRAGVPVFEPEAPALAALSDRVKTSFDPLRILNPGRMQKGR